GGGDRDQLRSGGGAVAGNGLDPLSAEPQGGPALSRSQEPGGQQERSLGRLLLRRCLAYRRTRLAGAAAGRSADDGAASALPRRSGADRAAHGAGAAAAGGTARILSGGAGGV